MTKKRLKPNKQRGMIRRRRNNKKKRRKIETKLTSPKEALKKLEKTE